MTGSILLTAILAIQLYTTPIRNTFVTAAESVIDTASAVDLHADQPAYDAQFRNLTLTRDNLAALVPGSNDDREGKALTAINNMIFTLSACRIQAIDGTDLTTCNAQFDRARNRAMESIHKHKANDTWLDGPPA